ncbi:allantoinase [Mrakia frigida]|uniref:allantoinase n=1 Tax=Mrakia frigida TaxID=29902 RepID=UPI003FCC1516
MAISAVTSLNVFLPSRPAGPATIEFDTETGKITAVREGVSSSSKDNLPHVLDLGSAFLIPGLVDCHVHLNEPGRTEWEGFATGTRAAASGGVTTLIDMPLNSIPPVTTVSGLEAKRAAAVGQLSVDVGFWGGVIPGNAGDIKPLIEAGVKGFKCFLIESGVEEFPCVDEDDLRKALAELEGTEIPLLFHAELDPPSSSSSPPTADSSDPTFYSTFLASRPDTFETSAIAMVIRLMKEFPSVPCHIVHLSSAEALPAIREAKKAGARLTVETCYHYLCIEAEAIPHRHTEFKCCPPIRSSANRELLWSALFDNTIDYIVSDHSPCVSQLKNLDTGDYSTAWGGISSLGLGCSLLWTEAEKRGFGMEEVVKWTSGRTGKMAKVEEVKGGLRVGGEADFAVFDPTASFTVTKDSLSFKNKLTPFEGITLQGRITATYLRGERIYSVEEGVLGGEPKGRML